MMQPCYSKKRGVFVRGHAERIAGTTKFRFFCKEGHSHTSDMKYGGKRVRGSDAKKARLQIGETGLRMFERWWSKDAGGVSFYCPGCTKKAEAA